MNKKDEKCKCSFAQSIVGDGCRYCQPQDYIDTLEMTIKEMQEDYDSLFNEKATIWKLEAHPKEWQGLSDDDMSIIFDKFDFNECQIAGEYLDLFAFAKAIEQKLKEKNT